MSIFEKKSSAKVCLDDTQSLQATIINTENSKGYTEYVIRVHRGPHLENAWHIHRRYNEFFAVHQELQASDASLAFPPKKLIGNMDREFVAHRLTALQNYLDSISRNKILSSQLCVKKFLDPQNYDSIKELGFTEISVRLRGELDLKVTKQLKNLGWRLRKEYYLVTSNSSSNDFLLTWVPFGPDKYLNHKQISAVLKSLKTLQHVNIASLIKSSAFEDGAWMLRALKKSGTLLDFVYGVKNPTTLPALKKYTNESGRKVLPVTEIIKIVTQILQALSFLHFKNIPYGHLHLGNIINDDGTIKLLEIENSLLGLPCYYRDKLAKLKFIHSMKDVDIYCLGLVTYELLYGRELSENEEIQMNECPVLIRPLLQIILVDSKENGLPGIKELLNIEVFQQPPPAPSPYLKFSSSLESFELNSSKTIERLRGDYNEYCRHVRELRTLEQFSDGRSVIICYNNKRKKRPKNEDASNSSKAPSVTLGSPSVTPAQSVTSLSTGDDVINVPENKSRSALLSAICNFNKGHLKKVTE